ncbi:uncharacterized protein M8220_011291 isoform 2-T9 [Acridotheres tristis]
MHADLSLFDVIGMENQITCYEAQMLLKLKVTGKLIEEICCSPSPPTLEPVKLKPNKHFRGSKDPLQELILTLEQLQIALKEVISREPVCVPSCSCCSSKFVWGKSFLHMDPWNETLAVQSQGAEMVQCDSGKLGALAVLLWKLKAEGRAGAGFDTEDCSAQHPGAFPEFLFPHMSESGAHSWHYLVSVTQM